MTRPFEKIHLIINPAAGADVPVLSILNTVFQRHGLLDWQVSLTHRTGDGTRLTQAALAQGADLIAVYGGDGTLMEVANGLLGTDVPLGILPGGTGNAMAFELNIPRVLEDAAELLCYSTNRRRIDMAQIGGQAFMLRAYTGLRVGQQASREMKERFGLLAYPIATMQMLADPEYATFRLTIDGQPFTGEGVSCVILNGESLGGIDFFLDSMVQVDDGLLDVFIINNDIQSLISMADEFLNLGLFERTVPHWQGRVITIESNPPQTVWLDGEMFGPTPVTITTLPQVLRVVVP